MAAHVLIAPASVRAWTYEALGVATFCAILYGARNLIRREQSPWLLFALGILLRVAGDATWTVFEEVFDISTAGPSGADIFYLGSYPVLVAALLQLTKRRSSSSSMGSLIDAVMLATAAGLLLWAFVIDPYFETNRDLQLVEQLTTIAYPLADLVLMAVVIRLAFSPGPRQNAYYLLVAGFALLLGGDAYGALETLTSAAPSNSLTSEGMLLGSLVVLGMASLHPSISSVTQTHSSSRERPLGRMRRLMLAAATLVAPAVLIFQPETGATLDIPIIAAGAAALALMSLARMRELHEELGETLAGLRRAADREQILRQVGERLVSARGRDGIYLAAIDAVHRLLPDIDRVRVFVAIGEGLHMTTVSASGPSADRLRGLPVRFDRTPAQVRARLLSGSPVEVDNESLIDPGDSGDWVIAGRATLAVPLLSSDQDLTGCVIVATEDPLPNEYTAALTAMGSQVSLALESAALNEDLLRQQSEAHFRSLVQAGSDVIIIADGNGRVRYASPAVERVFGYAPEDVIGHAISSTVHPDDLDSLEEHIATSREQPGTSRPIDYRLRHSDGTWRFVESVTNNLLDDPSVRGLVFTVRDVTESRALADQLRHQAFHDPLTGLANRALFADRVSRVLARRHRPPERAAVLFFDLDDFKTINDSLGHAAGDELLREVARRLEASLRTSDTAARLGGDEFAVLLEDVDGPAGVGIAAQHILDELCVPVVLEGRQVRISTSIGIALETAAREPVEVLLRNADAAMYAAKTQGGASYRLFEPSMHSKVVARLELGARLEDAVAEGQLSLRYQPIVDLKTGRVVKCEALLRWQHPERGLVSPLEFIPLAEETGSIVKIGTWLLRDACSRGREWRDLYPSADLGIGVNVSGRQLEDPTFVAAVMAVLDESGLDPSALTLEITESILMKDAEAAISRLHQLKRLGVQLAIDDFGTGYSSLGYLRQFPIDIIKIDKSFVSPLDGQERESQLVRTIVDLARGLGTKTVAEGIETVEQAEELARLGCHYGQGFHYSHPLEVEAFSNMLRRAAGAATAAGGY